MPNLVGHTSSDPPEHRIGTSHQSEGRCGSFAGYGASSPGFLAGVVPRLSVPLVAASFALDSAARLIVRADKAAVCGLDGCAHGLKAV